VGRTGPVEPQLRVYRPELQGLRAVAVALVVAYHVWFGRVSGGVDVFFLVSGFLLTEQLSRAAARGSLELGRRWVRTLVRLVPCAVVVLVATVVAGALLLPEGRWPQTLREVVAAALFLENWRLAADAVDYAARSAMSSPVQHFWSLSIQGQFFLVWPLVVALVALAVRGDAARLRGRLTVVALGVFVASLTYSVALTATNQPLAYVHSLTRLWEFAFGALLALTIDQVRLGAATRARLGWLGLAGLVACGAVLRGSTVFPGIAALWPTGCAALVLVAGTTGHRFGPDRLLGARLLRRLGDLSYPLYLWHWPVLVFALVVTGHDRLDALPGAAVVAASLALAVLTHLLVERPVLALSPAAGRRLVAAGLAVVFLAAGLWQTEVLQRSRGDGQVGDVRHPGALALAVGESDAAPLLPPPVTVTDDWVRIEHWDCTPMSRFPMDVCAQPVAAPERRIVVVGDSHAQQLAGALVPIAARHNWQLIAIIRGACPFSTASEVVPDERDCLDWNAAAAAEIEDLHPDAVVTLASRDVRAGLTEQTPPGFVAQWARLDALGIPVLAVRDTPRFDRSMPDCVQRADAAEPPCGVERAAVYAPEAPWTHLADVPSNVRFLDVANRVCGPEFCPAVIGNVLVYLDDNHITASYATSMADLVEGDVRAALGF
jgi:peptidoglycan/LPS O-acetylase OafA/YrhL